MRRLPFILLIFTFMRSAHAGVSFTNDVAPLLAQKCSACHNEKKAKGSFRLHTFAALMSKSADQDAAVLPGEPDRSRLYQLLIVADEADRMPQDDDPLSPDQIATIRRWIAEGAKFDGPNRNSPLDSFNSAFLAVAPPSEYPSSLPVTALAFSSDAKQLASSGYHEVFIWDAEKGNLLRRIRSLPEKIHDLAYSPDGKWLVVASGNPGKLGQVNAIDLDSAKAIHVLAKSSDVFLAIAFNHDGTTLAAAAADHSIRLIDWAAQQQSALIEQHADWVLDLAFFSDGKHLISASRDKTARMIQSRSGQLESTYQSHNDIVFAVALDPKGDRVFTAGRDRRIHIWEPKEAKKIAEIGGFSSEIYRLATSGERVFAAGADQTISEYRTTGQRERLRTYAGHRDAIFALAITRDGKRLASGSFDGEIRTWDTASGELLRAFPGAPMKSSVAASLHNPH